VRLGRRLEGDYTALSPMWSVSNSKFSSTTLQQTQGLMPSGNPSLFLSVTTSDKLNICIIKIINNLLNTYDNYTGK
jgi:hypothetical protein